MRRAAVRDWRETMGNSAQHSNPSALLGPNLVLGPGLVLGHPRTKKYSGAARLLWMPRASWGAASNTWACSGAHWGMPKHVCGVRGIPLAQILGHVCSQA
jgi:hypothetical protein